MGTKSKKYFQLIETAKGLFYHYGINRISIDEICKKSNVSKMTFYKYFKNKSEIVIVLIDEITKEVFDKFKRFITSNKSLKELLVEMISWEIEALKKIGKELINDLNSNSDPELTEYLKRRDAEKYDMIRAVLKKAQKKGDIRRDIKIELLVHLIKHLSNVFFDKDIQGLYSTPADLFTEMMDLVYYGIFKEKKCRN